MALSFESDAATLSDEFHHRVTARRTRAGPGVVGVEHEYVVRRAGDQVDFSRLIHELPMRGRALHPTDAGAYLLESGAAVMADGRVAEIATPPIPAGPGAATTVDDWATATEADLHALVGPEHSLTGGSTHISVQTDPTLADRLALIYARTLAAPMMLMIDRSGSPGLLVRPRPGRHEMCGEYATGDALRAAVGFALATTTALQRALATGSPLPPLLDVVLEPGRRRFGWYVDRRAFGVDLYDAGRETRLPLAHGGTIAAGDYLRSAWAYSDREARELLNPDEFELVDDVVHGRRPIPLEGSHPEGTKRASPLARAPLGRGLERRRRNGMLLEPVSATWDWMAFQVASNGDSAVALVPRHDLDGFLDRFEAGHLDEVLHAYLHRTDEGDRRELRMHAQTGEPGLHDTISPGPAMLPTDRFGIGTGPASQQRPGKLLPPAPESAVPDGTKGNDATAITVLGAMIAVLALALGVLGLARTSHAVVGEELDPRLTIDQVDGLIDDTGELWLRICFDEAWGETPPDELFSAFFGFINRTGDQETVVGWEWHDGVETPLFDTLGRTDRAAFVLDDGKVVIATGVFPEDDLIEFAYQSASWIDEATGSGAREDGFGSLEGSEPELGDPQTFWGNPVYDLTTGAPIASAPPTTTTSTTTSTTTTTSTITTTSTPSSSDTTTPAAAPPATETPSVAPPTSAVAPTTVAVTVAPAGTSSDDGRNWLWLLPLLFGFLLIGGGTFLMRTRTAPPSTPGVTAGTTPGTTPGSVPAWLEKGNDDRQPRTRVLR